MLLLALALLQADPSRLVEALGSEKIEERDAAVQKLKELGDAATPALEKAAASPDQEISARAKFALRLIAHRTLLTEPFRKAYPNAEERIEPGEAHRLFIEAGGFSGVGLRNPRFTARDLEGLVPAALKAAKEPGETVEVLEAIDRWRVKAAAPHVLEILKGEAEPAVHLEAACILSRWPETSTLPLLLERAWPFGFRGVGEINDRAHRARWATLQAAGALRGLSFLQDKAAVVARLGNPDAAVRSAAVTAIVRLGAREGAPKLRVIPDVGARMGALAHLADRESVPAFRAALTHVSPPFRRTAARGIAATLGREGANDLLPLLRDTDLYARSEAAEILGQLGAAEAVPGLRRMIAEDDAYLRETAAESLCRLGEREAAPLLIEETRKRGWQGWLLALNALRTPGAWKKLGTSPSKRDLGGTGREVLERLGREAGLAVEIPDPLLPEARRWLETRPRRRILVFAAPGPAPSLQEMLQSVLAYSPFDAVLDEGRIRILGRLQAQRFWEAWEEETRPR